MQKCKGTQKLQQIKVLTNMSLCVYANKLQASYCVYNNKSIKLNILLCQLKSIKTKHR